MLYPLVRPIAALILKVNFRKIYFSKIDRIPKDHPVILAANHPTAFIEPCILACFQPRDLHFLVRGDLFKQSFFRMLLKSLHMVPIFRLKDGGFSKLKNNFATLDRCFEVLRQRKVIMILAEGSCYHEKRLRTIKKGAARMAFGTYEKFQVKDIRVVPVGVNYAFAEKFRSDLMIEVGEPIPLETYLEEYDREPLSAIRQLTLDIEKELEKKVIIIAKKKDEELTEYLFELFRNNYPVKIWPIVSDESHHLHGEKRLADKVNKLKEGQKAVFLEEARDYFSQLKTLSISDFGLNQPGHYNLNNSITLLVGFIPFLLGLVSNAIPMLIANFIGNNFVKTIEFRQSVKVAAGMISYFLYFIALLILGWEWRGFFGLVLAVLVPVWGYFAIIYYEFFQRWWDGRKVSLVPEKTLLDLRQQRMTFWSKFVPQKKVV